MFGRGYIEYSLYLKKRFHNDDDLVQQFLLYTITNYTDPQNVWLYQTYVNIAISQFFHRLCRDEAASKRHGITVPIEEVRAL